MKKNMKKKKKTLLKKTFGETYYVLNTTDSQKIVNGFRYIKELLLQYHNFAMNEAYSKLVANNVKVYGVKSDAKTT